MFTPFSEYGTSLIYISYKWTQPSMLTLVFIIY